MRAYLGSPQSRKVTFGNSCWWCLAAGRAQQAPWPYAEQNRGPVTAKMESLEATTSKQSFFRMSGILLRPLYFDVKVVRFENRITPRGGGDTTRFFSVFRFFECPRVQSVSQTSKWVGKRWKGACSFLLRPAYFLFLTHVRYFIPAGRTSCVQNVKTMYFRPVEWLPFLHYTRYEAKCVCFYMLRNRIEAMSCDEKKEKLLSYGGAKTDPTGSG